VVVGAAGVARCGARCAGEDVDVVKEGVDAVEVVDEDVGHSRPKPTASAARTTSRPVTRIHRTRIGGDVRAGRP
jgi:hypothetical protein